MDAFRLEEIPTPRQMLEFLRRSSMNLLPHFNRGNDTDNQGISYRLMAHAILLTVIIASFWILDSLKDPVFAGTVGMEYQPAAKLWSVVTTLIVVCLYDMITGLVDKRALFIIVPLFYGVLFLIFASILAEIDLKKKEKDENISNNIAINDVDPSIDIQYFGYACYFAIESYGSLMVAMFWSFTNNIISLEDAKVAYGIIISCAQIGAIVGSTFATQASKWGISNLFILAAYLIFTIPLLTKAYFIYYEPFVWPTLEELRERERERQRDKDMKEPSSFLSIRGARTHSHSDSNSMNGASLTNSTISNGNGNGNTDDNNEETNIYDVYNIYNSLYPSISSGLSNVKYSCNHYLGGFYEGFTLVIRHRYVLLIFGVSTLYEVVVTIIDYQFKLMGIEHVSKPAADWSEDLQSVTQSVKSASVEGDFANLLGYFGQATNITSFFISFFGFSFLIKNLGVSSTLMIFPIVLFLSVIVNNLTSSLWVLFVFVSLIKALIFSLNDPAKELLYMPTSEDIKFKAKAWIDVFGARFAKALGSLFTSLSGGQIAALRQKTELVVLLVSIALIANAYYVGSYFKWLEKTRTIVGRNDVDGLQDSDTSDIGTDLDVDVDMTQFNTGYSNMDYKAKMERKQKQQKDLFEGVFFGVEGEKEAINRVGDEDEENAKNIEMPTK